MFNHLVKHRSMDGSSCADGPGRLRSSKLTATRRRVGSRPVALLVLLAGPAPAWVVAADLRSGAGRLASAAVALAVAGGAGRLDRLGALDRGAALGDVA